MSHRRDHKNPKNESTPEDKGKEPVKWTDKYLAWATIVLAIATIVLSYYTYMLFKDASKANDRNIDAIEAAKRSVAEQKRYDNISIALQDSIFKSNIEDDKIRSKHDEEVFELQKKSVDAQIRQLNEAKREYKANLQPILDYEKTVKDSIGEINIVNKGLGIAHIVSVEYIKGRYAFAQPRRRGFICGV